MTLEAVFKDLSAKWERLAEELEHDLLWSVMETKPAEEHALANHYVDGVTDLIAIAREGLAASQAVTDAGMGLGQAGQAVLRGQERYNVLVELFYSRLASYGRRRRLRRFGREKGGTWRGWAVHVGTALDRCRRPMDDLNRALFGCWQEVTDRLGLTGVSVQATNIGQKITVPAESRAGVEAVT
jgi:hypothetical protein